MSPIIVISRRDFLKVGLAAGGGLLLGFYLPGIFPANGENEKTRQTGKPFVPNAWLKIGTDGTVTVLVNKSEMGQGVLTSLPLIVAEELEADWAKIRVEQSPEAPVYRTMMGMQLTGGSTSVRGSWKHLREAGAAARQMLVTAAARTWGVSESTCRAENGEVFHPPSGKRLPYGALAEKAAALPVPKKLVLKDPRDYRLVGKKTARLDNPEKVNGKAVFGIDVTVPGLLVARVLRCPVFGGKVASFDDSKAKAVDGVRQVVPISSGIAVVADGFWPAKLGLEALQVRWDEGARAGLSSAAIDQTLREMAEKPGIAARKEGDAELTLLGSARRIKAVYQVPFLAHATMEPMNCTAHVQGDGCDVWVPTQAQTWARGVAAKITGLPPESVKIHTTLLGGGFGRRAEQDFVAEAVEISKAVGAPVKVIWSREDDMQHDFYRPATYNVLNAGLDKDGWPVAWTHRIVGPSIMARVFPDMVKKGLDPTSVEGAANLPYAIPHILVDYILKDLGVPVGFWRSVGNSQNAFIVESFIDEVAAAAGKDPFELRRHLLSKAPRHKAVLELAAEKAGWGQPLPRGRGRGIAVHESFGSFVAQVAEVSVDKDGEVRVHRVVCAIDCGTAINPYTVEAQMQSGIVYGLTAVLRGEITLKDGRVQQSNFDDYPLLRLNEMPEVEVHIHNSGEALGGVGEVATPPIAPAVANAVFAATGKRIRRLPIRAEELKRA